MEMTARVSMQVFMVSAHLRFRFSTASLTRGCPSNDAQLQILSGSEAAIRLLVRKSVSADMTASPGGPVVQDGCRLRYFTSRLDVAF